MSDFDLAVAIQDAVVGDRMAMEKILEQYMPLIHNSSFIDGRYDEDCSQYIMARLIQEIPKFNID